MIRENTVKEDLWGASVFTTETHHIAFFYFLRTLFSLFLFPIVFFI